jgi:serine/threonine protein kinase
MIGSVIGHYEIVEKLGEGGMGVVFKARDTSLNRFVAIKLLPAGKVGDENRIRRFTQEARTASALNHPNIVTILEISSHNGAPFIVMEFVPGKALDRLIPRNGMRLSEVFKIGTQIASALAAAAAVNKVSTAVQLRFGRNRGFCATLSAAPKPLVLTDPPAGRDWYCF